MPRILGRLLPRIFLGSIPVILGASSAYYYCSYRPRDCLIERILPPHVQYLLIGDTPEVFSAAQAIRARDISSKVVIVCQDDHPPYIRETFPRELADVGKDVSSQLKDQLYSSFKRVFFESPNFYLDISEYSNVDTGALFMARNLTVDKVDLARGIAKFGRDSVVFDRCFISPSALVISSKRHDLTTFDDFLEVFGVLENSNDIIIRGDSPLVAQIISILQTHPEREFNLTLIRRKDEFLLSSIIPHNLAEIAETELKNYGMNVIIDDGGDITLENVNGKVKVHVGKDNVVKGDIFLDMKSKREVKDIFSPPVLENGKVPTDEYLRVAPNVWAAGDLTLSDSPYFERRSLRGYDNAFMSGRIAGINMTGGDRVNDVIPMLWTYIGPVELEGCGVVDSDLQTVSVFDQESSRPLSERRGVVFYLENDVVLGFCLWNPSKTTKSHVLRQLVATGIKSGDILSAVKLLDLHNQERPEK